MKAQTIDLQSYFESLFDLKTQRSFSIDSTHSESMEMVEDSLQFITHISQNQLLDLKKFFALYPKFENHQARLSGVWNKMLNKKSLLKDLQSKKLTSIIKDFEVHIRVGVPSNKWKTVILPFFKSPYDFQEQYELTSNIAFGGNMPQSFKNVPMFSHSSNIDEILLTNLLSPNGIEAFKRIMWVLEKSVPKLSYNPMLPQIAQLLLVHFSEAETFGVIKCMFDRSKKPAEAFFSESNKYIYEPNWFLSFKLEEYKKEIELLAQFIEFRGQGFSMIRKHFRKYKFDIKNLAAEVFGSLFLGFFSLPTVLRIFGIYLTEGISVYYRVTLAILKTFQNDIVSCKDGDSIIAKLKNDCSKISGEKLIELMALAFELKIRDPKRDVPVVSWTNPFKLQDVAKPYFPTITDDSLQISAQHIEAIWEWLPSDLKLTKPVLAYSSKVHGWSIRTLCQLSKEGPDCFGMLLFVRTGDCIAFGAFVDEKFEIYKGGNRPRGTDATFIFQLEPLEKKYKATGKNDIHLVCDSEGLYFGAGREGAALFLDSDLLSGYTNKSETYDNEPLNFGDKEARGRFQCMVVEAYWLR